MAVMQGNFLIEGLSGMFGKSIVFRNMNGKTIASSPPRPSGKQSSQQRANRSKFRDASNWAKTALLDPVMKEYYQKQAKKLKLPNAYTAAITDYMRKPQVVKDHVSEKETTYSVTKKQFALKKVEVVIAKQDVNEIRPACNDGSEWIFSLTHEDRQGEVVVQITDTTGSVFVVKPDCLGG